MEQIFVMLASFGAGLIDAVVGGGGLVLLPALFAAFPSAPPATLIGTNKTASVWGTMAATYRRYARRVHNKRFSAWISTGIRCRNRAAAIILRNLRKSPVFFALPIVDFEI